MERNINPKRLTSLILILLSFVTITYGCLSNSTNLRATSTIIATTNTTQMKEFVPPLIIETDEIKQYYPDEPTLNPTVFLSTPTINAENRIELPGGYFILINDLGYELRIIDVETGVVRELFSERKLSKFIEWRDKGCKFVVLSEGNLELISLNGERVETLFTYLALQEKNLDPYGLYFSLSPNEQWVWYWQVSGNPYNEMGPESNYEVQNIFTVSKEFREGPYSLTKNGGGWLAVWSPIGEKIAYSDYDESGILQVFVSSVQGNDKTQITDFKYKIPFETYGTDIRQINWSPDSNNLAITYVSDESQESGLATVIIDPETGQLNYYQKDTRFLWWVDAASFMVRDMSIEENNTIYAQKLGVSQHTFTLKETEFPKFQNIQPFYSKHFVGFFALFDKWYFFVFNSMDGSVTPVSTIKMPDYLIESWISPPNTFPGVERCGR